MHTELMPPTSELLNKIVIVCGATASGKSRYAIQLAQQCNGSVINADSMQVYQELPILTAQPSKDDYNLCPHHLYGMISASDSFSVATWLELALNKIENVRINNQIPILVGGTGMYLSCLINGLAHIPEIPTNIKSEIIARAQILSPEQLHNELMKCDPDAAARIKIGDIRRAMRALGVFAATGIPLSQWQKQTQPYYQREQFYIINIAPPRALIYQQCDDRFINMLEHGVVDEVQQLIQTLQGVRYPKVLGLAEIIAFLQKEITWQSMVAQAQQYTRNYAKRQLTWFRNQLEYDW